MAYANDGTARSLYITVTKEVGGNLVQGYPNTYNGQNSWGNPSYPTLTDTQVRQLSDAAFTARYNAFVAYVESIESGLDFTTDIVGNGATKYDPTTCGTTTTTTEAVAPVYAFSVRYATYAVDACSGSNYVVYSAVPYPTIGNTIYKNPELTQKWGLVNGNFLWFASPSIHNNKPVEVNLTTGKIVAISNNSCSSPATTTTTTTAGSTQYQVLLSSIVANICTKPVTLVYSNNLQPFEIGTRIYSDSGLTTPVTGYDYVCLVSTGRIYNLDTTTGIIGTSGQLCDL